MTFQELLMTLERFFADRGCIIVQPYDLEVGAGTFSPHTLLRALGNPPGVQPTAAMAKIPTACSITISTR